MPFCSTKFPFSSVLCIQIMHLAWWLKSRNVIKLVSKLSSELQLRLKYTTCALFVPIGKMGSLLTSFEEFVWMSGWLSLGFCCFSFRYLCKFWDFPSFMFASYTTGLIWFGFDFWYRDSDLPIHVGLPYHLPNFSNGPESLPMVYTIIPVLLNIWHTWNWPVF